MIRVDIVFDRYSNQLQVIRGRLLRAFLELGIEPHWHEWDLRQEDLPEAISRQSSLAVLVDGVDVLSAEGSVFEHLYRYVGFFDGGTENLPSIFKITQVMRSRLEGSEGYSHQRLNPWLPLTVLPIIVAIYFFGTTCTICGPQGARHVSVATVSDITHVIGFMLPVVLCCLFFAVSGFVYRAKERHGYAPMVMGGFAFLVMLYGRLILGGEFMFWSGTSGLLLAAVWNAQLKRPMPIEACPRCPAYEASSELQDNPASSCPSPSGVLAMQSISR